MSGEAPSMGEMARWLREQSSVASMNNYMDDESSDEDRTPRAPTEAAPPHSRNDSGMGFHEGSPDQTCVVDAEEVSAGLGINFHPSFLLSPIVVNGNQGAHDADLVIEQIPHQVYSRDETGDANQDCPAMFVPSEDHQLSHPDALEELSTGNTYQHPSPTRLQGNRSEVSVASNSQLERLSTSIYSSTNVLRTNPSFPLVDTPSRSNGRFGKLITAVKGLTHKATGSVHRRNGSEVSTTSPQQRDSERRDPLAESSMMISNTGLPVGVVHPDVLAGSGDRLEYLKKEAMQRAAYIDKQKQARRAQVVGTHSNDTTLTLFIEAACASPADESPAVPQRQEREEEEHTPRLSDQSHFARRTPDNQVARYESVTPSPPRIPEMPIHDQDEDIQGILQIRGSDMSAAERTFWESQLRSRRHSSPPNESDSPPERPYYNFQFSESTNDEINRLNDLARLGRLANADDYPVVDTFVRHSHVSLRVTEQLDENTFRSHHTRMATRESVERDEAEAVWERLERETGGAVRNTKSSSRSGG